MTDETETRLLAAECTTEFTGGTGDRRQRGRVVVLIKHDDTVLVHDAAGYQPVAWLTRPESLFVEREPVVVTATDGDQRLRVTAEPGTDIERFPASRAGVPVGTCPSCAGYQDGTLVRAGGDVHCTGCTGRYGLPTGATVLESSCSDCGLPEIGVRRGAEFELCLDRRCEPLIDAVRGAFDRAWDCPECGSDLRVLNRGRLLIGCERYPECETGFTVPDGLAVGTCACGLPTFQRPGKGEHCLDGGCRVAGE